LFAKRKRATATADPYGMTNKRTGNDSNDSNNKGNSNSKGNSTCWFLGWVWDVGGGGVLGAGGDEVFGGFDGLDAAAGADRHAVEGGGGAGEVELAREGPALEETVDEAGVEDVAGSGGVGDRDTVGGGLVEMLAVPGEDALGAEGGGGETAAVAALHELEGAFEAGLVHQARGEVAADDEIVDVFEEVVDAGVGLVEIGDDGDGGGAGPAGGLDGGGGVVAVDMEGAGVDDPVALEVVGLEGEAVVAAAEDGALALGIDEDEGLGAGAAGDGGDAGFDTGVGEGLVVECGGDIVAQLADIAGAEAPVLAGDDGGGDLSAGEEGEVAVLGLGAAGGIGGEGNYGVGGVEADADEIDLGKLRHKGQYMEFCGVV
jgi:hypothetical protein